MKRPGAVVVTCVALGAIVVLGAGLQGTVRFSGLRWIPDFSPPKRPELPRASQPPYDTAATQPAAASPPSATLDVALILWVVSGIAALIALLLLWRWLARRPARITDAADFSEASAFDDQDAGPAAVEPAAPAVQRGLQRALDVLDAEGEPHDAIVKAWLGLQEAAADSGIRRRGSETPTEFTGRIIGRASADAGAAQTILNLYLRVRFGDHPATGDDVARLRSALRSLAASWDAADDLRRAWAPAAPRSHET